MGPDDQQPARLPSYVVSLFIEGREIVPPAQPSAGPFEEPATDDSQARDEEV